MEQNFTAQNIVEYDLFGTRNIQGIEKAIQVSCKKILVFTTDDFKAETVKLYRVSCDPSDRSHFFHYTVIAGFAAEYKEKQIVLTGDFSLDYNYSLKINRERLPVILDPKPGGILDKEFAPPDGIQPGLHFEGKDVIFRLWSPPAIFVELLLFEEDAQSRVGEKLYLEKKCCGMHELRIKAEDIGRKSLEGCFYQYRVFAYEKVHTALDPYAKSMAVFNPEKDSLGKGAVIKIPDFGPKEFKNSQIISNPNDVIAYEMHVRDYSSEPGFVDDEYAGSYTALAQKSHYLKDLGITHLQLMPVHKCHTLCDTDKRYSSDIGEIDNYNWGYDPLNYFSLEGRYAQNPEKPEARIREFQEMAKKLHQQGIGLILDVVFNHCYSAETFENAAPGCYLRIAPHNSISGKTGAGPSLESRRRAVRNLIIDALKYYIKVLGADGFRFDLMEFTDAATLKIIREEVGLAYNSENAHDLLLWGEAWEFKDIDYKESFTKLHRPKKLGIAMFNDVMRDACLGRTTEGGFFQGKTENVSRLASAVAGGINSYDARDFPFGKTDFFHPYNLFADTPEECLNFISIHDGLTLWDKINLTTDDAEGFKRLKTAKQALTALFTAQGKTVLHGGCEILRTKPVSKSEKNNSRALSSPLVNEEENSRYFHDNSYKSPDFTNMLRWSRLSSETFAPLADSLRNYVKGLILLRRKVPAFRMYRTEDIHLHLKFLENHADEPEGDCPKVHSFKSYLLPELKLKFINGPRNDILFLTGEVHPYDANPETRPLPVKFGKDGTALVKLKRKEIDRFDLNKWQSYHMLNVKLVRTPGEWDTPREYYSASGSNALSPCDIDDDYCITADLSKKDYSSKDHTREVKQGYLAYALENPEAEKDKEDARGADCFFVIHNAADEFLNFQHDELQKYQTLMVVADSEKCKLQGLKYDAHTGNKENGTSVKAEKDTVNVPPHTSVIIAGFK